MECIFCKIAAKKIPAKIIYENEAVVAFDDISPQAPIHKLIIPKHHIATLNDLNMDNLLIMGEMIKAAKELAEEYNIASSGYRVVMNCNEGAGQTVFHIHLHLLGGRTMHWPPG